MLTGKFKRDALPDATGSRAGYMAAKKKEGKTGWSNYDEFKDDEVYWKLTEVLDRIAKAKGG